MRLGQVQGLGERQLTSLFIKYHHPLLDLAVNFNKTDKSESKPASKNLINSSAVKSLSIVGELSSEVAKLMDTLVDNSKVLTLFPALVHLIKE